MVCLFLFGLFVWFWLSHFDSIFPLCPFSTMTTALARPTLACCHPFPLVWEFTDARQAEDDADLSSKAQHDIRAHALHFERQKRQREVSTVQPPTKQARVRSVTVNTSGCAKRLAASSSTHRCFFCGVDLDPDLPLPPQQHPASALMRDEFFLQSQHLSPLVQTAAAQTLSQRVAKATAPLPPSQSSSLLQRKKYIQYLERRARHKSRADLSDERGREDSTFEFAEGSSPLPRECYDARARFCYASIDSL
jgi:hypothetical protein